MLENAPLMAAAADLQAPTALLIGPKIAFRIPFQIPATEPRKAANEPDTAAERQFTTADTVEEIPRTMPETEPLMPFQIDTTTDRMAFMAALKAF